MTAAGLQTSQRAGQWDAIEDAQLRGALRRLDVATGMAEHAAWVNSMGRGAGASAAQLDSIRTQVQSAAHGVKAAASPALADYVAHLERSTGALLAAAETRRPDLRGVAAQLDKAMHELALARERTEQPKRDRERLRATLEALRKLKRDVRADAAAATGSTVLASYYRDQQAQ